METVILRPDSKGRINLGDLAHGVSSYRVVKGDDGSLTLNPYLEIPFTEKWIFENKDILEAIKKEFHSKVHDVVLL